nr:PREDICTED: A-kinase anchor protein 9-like [Struthio camelus australis]
MGVLSNEEENFHLNKIFSRVQLAQFRQRKAQSDGQNASKKQKRKKKTANIKDDESLQDGPDIDRSRGDETSTCSSRRGAAATADFTIIRTLHSGEIIKHNQTYTIEPESEISTTVEDYSSEVLLILIPAERLFENSIPKHTSATRNF